jgi:hypothetical protein
VTAGPYRDGTVHVLAERCSTCVFRPGNLMSLAPGRLRDLLDSNLAADSALQCHQTLPEYPNARPPAVCRGFFDHPRAAESLPLRMARTMGLVTFDA